MVRRKVLRRVSLWGGQQGGTAQSSPPEQHIFIGLGTRCRERKEGKSKIPSPRSWGQRERQDHYTERHKGPRGDSELGMCTAEGPGHCVLAPSRSRREGLGQQLR